MASEPLDGLKNQGSRIILHPGLVAARPDLATNQGRESQFIHGQAALRIGRSAPGHQYLPEETLPKDTTNTVGADKNIGTPRKFDGDSSPSERRKWSFRVRISYP